MYKEITLDCSMLESPEPMNLVVENLHKIEENSYIKMIHRMEPMMLYTVLKQNGFKYEINQKENQVLIYIFNNDKIKDYIRCLQD